MTEQTSKELFTKHTTRNNVNKPKLFPKRSSGSYDFLPSSTSGDSSNHQVFIKKEEESHLLADNLKVPVGAAAMTSDGLPVDITYVDNCSEQQETINQNNDDMKEAAGDSLVKNDNEDYLESKEFLNKAPDSTADKQDDCDKVDSGLLRIPSPPDKLWKSNVSTSEEEDCDITCMYYTLQCCDCVIT